MPQPGISLTGIAAGMIGPSAFNGEGSRMLEYGNIVRRAAGALAQTGLLPLFTIVGDVALVQLYGKVGTAIQAQADATKLVFNPTVGTDVDLSATVDLNGKVTKTMLSITGIVADAMIAAGLAVRGLSVPLFLQDGTLDLSCAASNTGTIAWTALWVPLSDGATLVAA